MNPIFRIAVPCLAILLLDGCSSLPLWSEAHPTTESRYTTPQAQAYWTDRTWRHDKADEWARELDRQSAARMARYMGN